jgi:hypothetical protein
MYVSSYVLHVHVVWCVEWAPFDGADTSGYTAVLSFVRADGMQSTLLT